MSQNKQEAPLYRVCDDGDHDSNYEELVGPKFSCMLTEPEDRTWTRDLSEAWDRLNLLHSLLLRADPLLAKIITTDDAVLKPLFELRREIANLKP